ncbi:MAG: 5-dehydro-2-deoxygluconokinase [Propionibacteriaceae bacterium]|jgi:5-dehydro-2-deoxygluconokinase|nr:5-dehydro-2-deoxygluconokinase [Propionibacteriaceae bacterium]
MTNNLDLVAIGRVGVDIYPTDIGVDLEDVQAFGKYIGGTAANVAIAVARYGHRSALIAKVGNDAFGRYVRRDLAAEFGVNTDFLGTDPNLLTPVTFCAIKPPEDFPLYFYRSPNAPDMTISADDILRPDVAYAIQNARVFWSIGSALSAEPSASALRLAYHLRREFAVPGACHAVFDLDYRPMFWDSEADAHRAFAQTLPYVNVVVGNQKECAVAVGAGTPDEMADRLLAAGTEIAVVKMGSEGVLGKTADERVVVPPVKVETVNGLGAGDAFGGALSHGLLSGWPLERTLSFANAAGAYVASQIACSSAMPDEATVEDLIARNARSES